MKAADFADAVAALSPSSARPEGIFDLDAMRPKATAAPVDRSTAAALLQWAAGEGVVCVPWGGGTRQEMGFLPPRYDLAISTENLSRVVDVQPGDLTVTVEAGITLRELQEILAPHRQFVALESPAPERETIGGLLATGASALLRHAYGGPRDQLIGVAAAMPDGSVTHGGGRVVKNVAGYDLCKLYTGSMGTLGVIVEATFRVRPLPPMTRTWLGSFPDAAAAEEALAALMDSPLQPTFLQALDPGAVEELALEMPELAQWGGRWVLALGADGHAALSEWSVEEASRQANSEASLTLSGEPSAAFRQALVQRCGPRGELCARISVLSSDLLMLLEGARAFGAEQGLAVSAVAAAGNGVGYLNFRRANPAIVPTSETWSRLVEWLNEQALRLSGSCVLLRCPRGSRQTLPVWGYPAAIQGKTWPLMQRLRAALDPAFTLNRGRLFPDEEPGSDADNQPVPGGSDGD